MLTIICGEDIISSRNYYLSRKKDYAVKGYEIRDVKAEEIAAMADWMSQAPSLFAEKRVFFAQHLNKHVRKDNKVLIEHLKSIERMKDVDFVTWESVSLWELKISKLGKIKEFKPHESIFKLMDSLYPGNRMTFLTLLDKLSQNLDENFTFLMLTRQVRNLILVKEGQTPPRIQSWQMYKLQSQARHWKIENLINFYESLFKIEVGLKTGTTPFSSKDSLEILACHFL